MKRLILAALLALASQMGYAAGPPPPGTFFSIDAASPSAGIVSPADILVPGPMGGPPVVAVPFAALGLLPGDDIDALAFLGPVNFNGTLHFSVDRAAVGVPGPFTPMDVLGEAGSGQAAGDIFRTWVAPAPVAVGPNSLETNQDMLGLMPVAPPGVPAPAPIDNLDALEYAPAPGFMPGPGITLFSLVAGSPTLGVIGASAADMLVWTGAALLPAVYGAASAVALGLAAGDDIDGFAFTGPGGAGPIFSLAPGSPSLAGFGVSPGDVLLPGGAVFMPAAGMGLLPTDNLNALAAVPESDTYVLMLAGLGMVAIIARRRRARRG